MLSAPAWVCPLILKTHHGQHETSIAVKSKVSSALPLLAPFPNTEQPLSWFCDPHFKPQLVSQPCAIPSSVAAFQNNIRVLKLLSEDPTNYADAPREGIRRILEQVTGQPHPRDSPLSTLRIASIRMGTTVATNALLERRGERVALAVTQGFPDLLHIGNQVSVARDGGLGF